jgi:hypothetical protein
MGAWRDVTMVDPLLFSVSGGFLEKLLPTSNFQMPRL